MVNGRHWVLETQNYPFLFIWIFLVFPLLKLSSLLLVISEYLNIILCWSSTVLDVSGALVICFTGYIWFLRQVPNSICKNNWAFGVIQTFKFVLCYWEMKLLLWIFWRSNRYITVFSEFSFTDLYTGSNLTLLLCDLIRYVLLPRIVLLSSNLFFAACVCDYKVSSNH